MPAQGTVLHPGKGLWYKDRLQSMHPREMPEWNGKSCCRHTQTGRLLRGRQEENLGYKSKEESREWGKPRDNEMGIHKRFLLMRDGGELLEGKAKSNISKIFVYLSIEATVCTLAFLTH